MKGKI